MLVKPLTAFIVGAVTVASSISAALGAPGRAGFVFGVLTTLFLVLWALGSPSRQQWAGKFLLRLSGARVPVKAVKVAEPPPLPKEARESKLFTDVVLGLRSLKTDKETARWAAGQATMRLPNGDFQETFKLAVQCAIGRV